MADKNIETSVINIGLTKQEYFAGIAMGAIVSNPFLTQIMGQKELEVTMSEKVSKMALEVTNALINKLESNKKWQSQKNN